MSKTYKNDLLKKKNRYESPKMSIFKKIRTKTYEWELWTKLFVWLFTLSVYHCRLSALVHTD